MNKKLLLVVAVLVVIIPTSIVVVSANGDSDIAKVREATARFHRTEVAQAAGWDLREGLDNCFDKPPEGGMGYHYINIDILDAEVEMLKPEAMVYEPGPDGQLQLAAVEYIVDQASWDAANPGVLPEVLGRDFHLNSSLQVYVLHAWIWKNNPSGMFEDWNPDVSCPEI